MKFSPLKRPESHRDREPLFTSTELAGDLGIDPARLQRIIGAAVRAKIGPPVAYGWRQTTSAGRGKVSRYHRAPFLAWWEEWVKTHPDAVW